jgi:hypothetical protein
MVSTWFETVIGTTYLIQQFPSSIKIFQVICQIPEPEFLRTRSMQWYAHRQLLTPQMFHCKGTATQ